MKNFKIKSVRAYLIIAMVVLNTFKFITPSNVGGAGFLQNTAKAMESYKLESKLEKLWDVDCSVEERWPSLEQPTEFSTGLRKGDLVCREDVINIYEDVKRLRNDLEKNCKFEKEKYEIYDILCVIAENLLKLDGKTGIIGVYKAKHNGFIERWLRADGASLMFDISKPGANVLKELEAIKNDLYYIENFFKDYYFVDNEIVYYLNRLSMYVVGWMEEFNELGGYINRHFSENFGSFSFKPDKCLDHSSYVYSCVKKLKGLENGKNFKKRDLSEFFKNELVEPTKYSTSFKKEEIVTHKDLVDFFNMRLNHSEDGVHSLEEIKCSDKEDFVALRNLVEEIVSFEECSNININNLAPHYISNFKEIYNKALVVLQKDESELNDIEKKCVSDLYKGSRSLIARLNYMYTKLDCLINKLSKGCLDYNYATTLNYYKKPFLYLNGWVRTLVGIANVVSEKFSFVDGGKISGPVKLHKDFFDRKLCEPIEFLKDISSLENEVMFTHADVFYDYSKEREEKFILKVKIDDFRRDMMSPKIKEDKEYLKFLLCSKLCDLIEEVLAFEKFGQNYFGNNTNTKYEHIIANYILKYNGMLPTLGKFFDEFSGSEDMNKIFDLYKDTIKLMLKVKTIYSDIWMNMSPFIFEKKGTVGVPAYVVELARKAAGYVEGWFLTLALIAKEISDKFNFVNNQKILDDILKECPPLVVTDYPGEDSKMFYVILGYFKNKNVFFKNLNLKFAITNKFKKKVKIDDYEYNNTACAFVDVPIDLSSFFSKGSDGFIKEFSGIDKDEFVPFDRLCKIYDEFCLEKDHLNKFSNIGKNADSNVNESVTPSYGAADSAKLCNEKFESLDSGNINVINKIENVENVDKALHEFDPCDVFAKLGDSKEKFLNWFNDFCEYFRSDVLMLEGSFNGVGGFVNKFMEEYKEYSSFLNALKANEITTEQRKKVSNIYDKVSDLLARILKIHRELLNKMIMFDNIFYDKLPDNFKYVVLDNFRSVHMYTAGLCNALRAIKYSIIAKFYV